MDESLKEVSHQLVRNESARCHLAEAAPDEHLTLLPIGQR